MGALLQDLRYALRTLARAPGFAVAAVATLALGIGANTAIFSAANAMLLRPLPVEDPDRLVAGFAMREGWDPYATSFLEYDVYRREGRSFAGIGLGTPRFFNLLGRGDPERLPGAAVTAGYLTTLGVEPFLGRGFREDEDRAGGPAVVLLSHGLWQRRFGGDRTMIGRTINLEGRSHSVLGILPPGFNLPYAADVWTPLQLDAGSLPLEDRARTVYELVARLRPGVTLAQADVEVKRLAGLLAREYPQIRRGWSYKIVPLRRHLLGDLHGRVQGSVLVLLAAVGFLLAICCANVASLLLARGIARKGEIAIRLALGAGRRRILRQLLTESALLALAGGVTGVLLAFWIAPLLSALNPVPVVSLSGFLADFRIDARVLGFCFLVTALTGALSGAIPAWRFSRANTGSSPLGTRSGVDRGAGARRWLDALVAAEIAVAMTLLVGSVLMVQSFRNLQRVEPGFRPDHLLTLELPLSASKYPDHRERVVLVEGMLQKVQSLPGVASAGATTNIPLPSVSIHSVYTVEGRPRESPTDVPMAALRLVSAGYLETLGASLLQGRLLRESDRAASLPVAVVSEELARREWPGESAIGKRIRRGRPQEASYEWLTVVGVIRNIKEDSFNFRVDQPAMYLPYAQEGRLQLNMPVVLVVRASGDPGALTAAIRGTVRSVDPDQPVSAAGRPTENLAEVLAADRFGAVLAGTLAPLGLLLAALGLYAVMAFSVLQRRAEIGLRMALGARPRDVRALVFGQGGRLIAAGLAAGIGGAWLLTRLLSGFLFQVSPTDSASFLVAGVLLTAVALLACGLPARRATRVDPIRALRAE